MTGCKAVFVPRVSADVRGLPDIPSDTAVVALIGAGVSLG